MKYQLRYNSHNEKYEVWEEEEYSPLEKFGMTGGYNKTEWNLVSSHDSQKQATYKINRMKKKPSKIIKEYNF